MESKIKVIIVDDHQIFRKGLVLQLNELEGIEVVAEADNGKEFIEILNNHDVDVVLMDIKMPEMNGVIATKKALRLRPGLKILGLSMFGEEEYLQNMLDAGAKGFMLKNVSIDELERGIRTIIKGKNYFSDELISILTNNFIESKLSKKEETIDDFENFGITKREREMLKYICIGYSNNEIAKIFALSPRTIDGHRCNLISKTGSKNTVGLVNFAIKNKLV